MKKSIVIISIFVLALMVFLPGMSYAWGRGGHYGPGHHHGYHRGYGWGPAVGGFFAGAVIGSAFARPVYVAPPPVYVAPPPPVVYYYPPPPPHRVYVYPY